MHAYMKDIHISVRCMLSELVVTEEESAELISTAKLLLVLFLLLTRFDLEECGSLIPVINS